MLNRYILVRLFCLQPLVLLRLLLMLGISASAVSCGIDPEGEILPDITLNNQVLRRPLDVSGSYVINPLTGDSIVPILGRNRIPLETGNLIPAKGRIDASRRQPTKVFPAKLEKLEMQFGPNIRPVAERVIYQPLVFDTLLTEKNDAYVLTGMEGDTIPTGIPVVLKGKKVSVKYPQPTMALPPILHYESGVNLKRLDEDQGLNYTMVTGIVEDALGTKWISYWGGGLSKYDGQSFWHFTTKQGLPTDFIWNIFAANDGKLWLATQREGIIVFDGEYFTQYAPEEGFPNGYVKNILEDNKGNIWMITPVGMTKFDGRSFTHFSLKEGLIDQKIFRIFQDLKGDIWLVADGKISRYDGNSFLSFSIKHPQGEGYLNPIFEDHDGNLWLSAKDEIFKYNGSSISVFSVNIQENSIRWCEDIQEGNVWLAYYSNHIYKYDGKDFWAYHMIDEVPITQINKDDAGNMWFCTVAGGIYTLRENSFVNLKQLPGRLRGGKDHIVWTGNRTGLFQYEGNSFSKLEGSEYEPSFRYVTKDRNDNIWMALHNGFAKYDGQTLTYFENQQINDENSFNFILEDYQGNLWFAQNNGHLIKYDSGDFTIYDEQDGLPPYNFVHIFEDQNHILWFGSNGGGLVRYDGNSFTVFSEKEGLSSNHIISIQGDDEGNIWIGTKEMGLAKFNGTDFTFYHEGNGLCNNLISSLVPDSKSRIWVGTNNGLSLLVPDQENHYNIYSFDKKDGLLENGFRWNSWAKASDGIIWHALNSETVQINIDNFSVPSGPISVHLDHLNLNGRFVDFRDDQENLPAGLDYKGVPAFLNYPLNPTFPFKNNHLTFYLSATDWSAPHKIKYSYRLISMDEGWSVPSSDAKADFRNLSPGWHTFEVRAIGASQKWSEPFTYTFRVLPPWWRTWWAYSLYLVTFVAIIRALYLFQLRRQFEKQETENLKALDTFKNELYTNITHEFRTPLTVISGMADQIENQLKIKELIKRNSLSLLNLVNQILDLRKLELGKLKLELVQGDVVQYLQYIIASYEAMAELKGVELHFIPKEKALFMDFDQEKLLRIVSNLLSNAIKFTPEDGRVYLMLEKSSMERETGQMVDALYLSVTDTGAGIPQDKQAHIFDRFYQVEEDADPNKKFKYRGPGSNLERTGSGIGLALTKDLVTLMGGNISLESTPGKGSSFTVLLPISRDAPKVEVEQQTVEDLSTLEVDQAGVTRGTEPLLTKTTVAEKENELSLLIIEDNQDVQQYLTSLLESKYTIYLADHGREGIAMAFEYMPDLIISDVMMPEKDGFEVCDTLKNDDRTSHIPIVLLTAKTSVESRIQGLERGADAYLAKPFHEKELFIRLEKLVELRRLLQQRYQHIRPPVEAIQTPAAAAGFEKEDAFIAKLQRIVEDHLDDADFGPSQLCEAMGMSRSHLHLKIKALTDRSTSIFIRTIRLHKAKELLHLGALNVTEAAKAVGFNDLSYFSKKFTEEFGVNPQQVIPS